MKDVDETLSHAAWLFLSDCRLRNLSPLTVEWYDRKLTAFCQTFHDQRLADLTTDHVRGYLNSLSVHPTTRNGSLRTLKAFFKFCVAESRLTESPVARLEPAKEHRPIIETFSDDQIAQLLKAIPQRRFVGCRDFALILLLLDSGARIAEALDLKLTDLRFEPTPSIHIRHGKGDKARELPIGKTTVQALTRYLSRRRECKSEYVFVSATGGRLDRARVRRFLMDYGHKAKITGIRLSPHTLRHTFAKKWILAGGDAFSLQRMLGHTSLSITQRYVALFANDLQTQHQKYSPVDSLESILPVRRKRLR